MATAHFEREEIERHIRGGHLPGLALDIAFASGLRSLHHHARRGSQDIACRLLTRASAASALEPTRRR